MLNKIELFNYILNLAIFTSAGSLIRQLKSRTITYSQDKDSNTPVNSLKCSLKAEEDNPFAHTQWSHGGCFYYDDVKQFDAKMCVFVYSPVLIWFSLYVSWKPRATPLPQAGLSVWRIKYPIGEILPRLTGELLLHQDPLSIKKIYKIWDGRETVVSLSWGTIYW